MRYSIMLQVVSLTTLILLAAAALFAWLQTRPSPQPPQRSGAWYQNSRGRLGESRQPPLTRQPSRQVELMNYSHD